MNEPEDYFDKYRKKKIKDRDVFFSPRARDYELSDYGDNLINMYK